MSYSLVSRSDRVLTEFCMTPPYELHGHYIYSTLYAHTIRMLCQEGADVLTITVSTLSTESMGQPLCQEVLKL